MVEASQGHCLDPLTCLGPQHSSQSPQGEGRGTWSPPPRHWPRPMQTRPPTRQEDTVEPGLGRRSRRRAPQGPAGPSDVSSHWARPRCPLVPSALAGQTTGSKYTQSGLLAPLWGPLDLEGPSLSGQLPPPFSSPRGLLTPAGGGVLSPEPKSSTTFPRPNLSSSSVTPGQTLTGCWMPENWSTRGSSQPGAHPPRPCSLPHARGLRAHLLRNLRVLPRGSQEFKKVDKQKEDPTDPSLAKS